MTASNTTAPANSGLMSFLRSRSFAWTVVVVSTGVFAAAIPVMVSRIREFNAHANLKMHHAEVFTERTFQVQGYPRVTLKDEKHPTTGKSALRLTYGDRDEHIEVKSPPAELSDLGGYEEWFKPLLVSEVGRSEGAVAVNSGGVASHEKPAPGTEHLLLVNRRTPAGFDPESWGAVRKIEWVFDFYDLKRDGTIERFTRRWPRSDMAEKRLEREAKGDPAAGVQPDERSKALWAIPPLEERSMESFAALYVMPKTQVPKLKFNNTAFSPTTMGWTLPASMLAGLTFTVGLIFAVAPRRKIDTSAAPSV